jgi:hypothetical protein
MELLTRSCVKMSVVDLIVTLLLLKRTRAMSIAVKYGSETDTMNSSTTAQKRKTTPGMQNERGMTRTIRGALA